MFATFFNALPPPLILFVKFLILRPETYTSRSTVLAKAAPKDSKNGAMATLYVCKSLSAKQKDTSQQAAPEEKSRTHRQTGMGKVKERSYFF